MNNKNYDTWERSYFKYLFYMYIKIYNNNNDFSNMFLFFKYIYSVSSRKISQYLDKMTPSENNLYLEYLTKRHNSYIK